MAKLETFVEEGERSAANQLARRTGTSVGQARRNLETAQRMEKLDRVFDAASSGNISPAQLEIICDAGATDPTSQDGLIEAAASSTIAELREEAARVKTSATDEDERRKKIREERYLRTYNDSDGGWNLRFRNNPEVGAEIMAALSPIAERFFEEARTQGRRERIEAYGADALLAMARAYGGQPMGGQPMGGLVDGRDGVGGQQDSGVPQGAPDHGAPDHGAPDHGAPVNPAAHGHGAPDKSRRPQPARSSTNAKVIVRVDLQALLRGYRAEGEVCEVAGFGPVAVSAVREMVETGDPFLAAVATVGKAVTGVAHLGRRPTAHQTTALQWLYPTCAVKGCSATSFLEFDHRENWSETHFTLFDLLDRLCTHHHDLKSTKGWMLVQGTGKREFVSPDDPRHPRYEVAA